MNRLKRGILTLHRRGISYIGYLITGYLLPKAFFALVSHVSLHRLKIIILSLLCLLTTVSLMVLVFIVGLKPTLWLMAILCLIFLIFFLAYPRITIWRLTVRARQLAEINLLQKGTADFTSWEEYPLPPETRTAVEAFRDSNHNPEVILGQIDNDGRVLPIFGNLPFVDLVSPHDFVTRRRFPLDILLFDGKVLVRKDFRGNREKFVHEWYNLELLFHKANLPAVYQVDERRTLLYKNLIPGPTLHNLLVKEGAKILTVQTKREPELAPLEKESCLRAVWDKGTKNLPQCLPETFLQDLEAQLDLIHRCGVANLSLTFGNVIRNNTNGMPFLIDLESARVFSNTTNLLFSYYRDQDQQKFNQIYGRNLLTEASARALLGSLQIGYAPIDLGSGLTTAGFWSTDSGTGRWEYFNRDIITPLIVGKRILDLGSHNGVMPLMMLRAGAKEVVGLELSNELVEAAQAIHRIFEWRDMKKYSFKILPCNMLEMLHGNWEGFDVVTAFCSLYYLKETEMAKMVKKAAEICPLMIVQAKTDTRGEAKEKKRLSSVSFLKALLEANGFPNIQVINPTNFSRPLLIGKRT